MVRVKPRSCNQGRCKNDAYIFSATEPNLKSQKFLKNRLNGVVSERKEVKLDKIKSAVKLKVGSKYQTE